jgi:hypothetical protein
VLFVASHFPHPGHKDSTSNTSLAFLRVHVNLRSHYKCYFSARFSKKIIFFLFFLAKGSKDKHQGASNLQEQIPY